MITINTVSSRYFSLDGINFARIFQPLAQGSDAIGIYSIYDTKLQLKNSTKYTEFVINGITYASQETAMTALLGILWATEYDVEALEGRIENIELNQVTGVVVYSTLASLPATGTLLVSYKVSNDTTSTNNGFYHWDGASYIKDAGTLSSEDIDKMTFEKELEFQNEFINSPESGYPEAMFYTGTGTGTRSISLIDTPTDAPFNNIELPKVISHAWTGEAGELRLEFSTSKILGTNGLTLAFWTKKSQLTAASILTVSYYSGSWQTMTIPTTVGGISENATYTAKLKRVVEFGDWVLIQFTAVTHVRSIFRFRFNYTGDGTVYFANLIGYKDVIDVNQFTVRYKGKFSTTAGRIQDALQGIGDVYCYGDSLTAASWPAKLGTLLGEKYTVYNRGVGGEVTLEIAARQGGIPCYVVSVEIPATVTPVVLGNITSLSGMKSTLNDSNVRLLLQHETQAGINPCFVEGVECTLAWTGANNTDVTGEFTLTRNVAGTARTTGIKSVISTANMILAKKAKCNVFFIGQNGGWNEADPDTLVAQFQKMVDFLEGGRYIVVSTHGHSTYGTTVAVADAMRTAFGARYINLREYMALHGIYDAGLTPTSTDLSEMALGNIAPQLTTDGTHLTDDGYQLVAEQVYQKMVELGYNDIV